MRIASCEGLSVALSAVILGVDTVGVWIGKGDAVAKIIAGVVRLQPEIHRISSAERRFCPRDLRATEGEIRLTATDLRRHPEWM